MTAPVKILSPEFALDTRSGWPADLRVLIDRYPRGVWEGHANLGAMAQFWLQRHDMFREIAAALEQATAAFRDGTASAQDLRAWFPSRLQFFLQQLQRAPPDRGSALFSRVSGGRGAPRARVRCVGNRS
jgi:hypothetical protein